MKSRNTQTQTPDIIFWADMSPGPNVLLWCTICLGAPDVSQSGLVIGPLGVKLHQGEVGKNQGCKISL